MTTTENEVQVYKEILNQLGGNRFLAMTGSKNLVYSSENPNWLSMRLTRNKIGAQFLKIELTVMDTYTMTFSKNVKVGYSETLKVLKVYENVYNEDLQEIFTSVTGLNTHL